MAQVTCRLSKWIAIRIPSKGNVGSRPARPGARPESTVRKDLRGRRLSTDWTSYQCPEILKADAYGSMGTNEQSYRLKSFQQMSSSLISLFYISKSYFKWSWFGPFWTNTLIGHKTRIICKCCTSNFCCVHYRHLQLSQKQRHTDRHKHREIKALKVKINIQYFEVKFYRSTNQKFVSQIAYPLRIMSFTSSCSWKKYPV